MSFPEHFPAELIAVMDTPAPVSVRFNPFKVTVPPALRSVEWCRYGYYLDRRPSFALDPMWHAGAYYVQEASSMFVGGVLDSWEGLRVLDLCAAPGGKATLLSTLVGLDGLVVANEPIRARARVLADNVARWGLGNIVVTCNDPSHFAGFEEWFDVVLVDAPCSGEGMFRRHPEARGEWSEAGVELCSRRQRRILGNVAGVLKPGGTLIYSTCTFNRVENEDNVAWLMDETGWELALPGAPAGVERTDLGLRFWPHRVEGEGFFVAALRRGDGRSRVRTPKARRSAVGEVSRRDVCALSRWVGQSDFMRFGQVGDNFYGFYGARMGDVRTLADSMAVLCSGVQMGRIFKGELKPEHPLALFHDLDRGAVSCVDLPSEAALDYLRLGDVDASVFSEGMNLVCCEGFPLGWAKRIGERVNNLYPKELRIVNL